MKKNRKIFYIALFCVPLFAGVASCGGLPENFEDADTITIEPFSRSGFGNKYIETIFDDWKKATGSNFKLNLDESTKSGSSLIQDIRSGINKSDIYFTGVPSFNMGFYDETPIFEDLTELLSVKPEGNKTIQEKIIDFDAWKMNGSKLVWNNDDSISFDSLYVLPFTRTFTGWIFDYQAFVNKGLLFPATYDDNDVLLELRNQGISFHEGNAKGYLDNVLIFESSNSEEYCNYKAGDIIMRAGRDKKYGTYDDGLPLTYEEFDEIVDKICAISNNVRPFVGSRVPNENYFQALLESIFVQEAGVDCYNALTRLESNGVDIPITSSFSTPISWKNGYEIYNSEFVNAKLEESLQIVQKYVLDNKKFYYTESVRSAQSKFILGGLDDTEFTGMLFDGNWFENQAKDELISTGQKKAGRGYGQVDYRFMFMPTSENGKGIDGSGNGAVLSAPETGGIAVRKQPDNNPEKRAAIMSFLSYLLRDESLSKIVQTNGLIMGYKFDMTKEQMNSLSPFTRTCYQILHDNENVKCCRLATDLLGNPFNVLDETGNYLSSESSFLNYPLNASTLIDAFNAFAFTKIPAKTICGSFKSRYTKETWNVIYTEMKNKLMKTNLQ